MCRPVRGDNGKASVWGGDEALPEVWNWIISSQRFQCGVWQPSSVATKIEQKEQRGVVQRVGIKIGSGGKKGDYGEIYGRGSWGVGGGKFSGKQGLRMYLQGIIREKRRAMTLDDVN